MRTRSIENQVARGAYLIGVLAVSLAVSLLLASCLEKESQKPYPTAVKGVIDLRNWNFADDGPVPLSGQWGFSWNTYVDPGAPAETRPGSSQTYIRVPQAWNGQEVDGHKLPGHGFATYRLTVLLGGGNQDLALKMLDMATAYSIFVNGRTLYSSGRPGLDAAGTVPGFVPRVVEFKPDGRTLDLVCQVANFHHRLGGAWEVIRLGTAAELENAYQTNLIISAFLLGSILIMGLYHLALFALRTSDRSPLFFGIFCLLVAVRSLTTGERYINHLLPNLAWEFLSKAEYLSFYLAVMVFPIFQRHLFPGEISQKVVDAISAITLLVSAVILVFPARVYSYTTPWFQAFTILVFFYCFYGLLLAIKRGRDGSVVFLAGFAVLFLAALNDILYSRQLIESEYLLPLGVFVFILTQAILLSKRFAQALDTVEKQRLTLSEKNLAYEEEIRARRQVEIELKERERKYSLLADNITDNIWLLGVNTLRLTYVSPSVERITGFTEAQSIGRHIEKFLPPSSFELIRSILEKESPADHGSSGQDGTQTLEMQLYHKDGSIVWTEINTKFILDQEGRPVELLGVTRDISQRKRLESQLRQAQKMEAVGTLAGGIAHDFNNIIQVIHGYVELLLMGRAKTNSEYQKLKEIQATCVRAAKLVTQLLTFSRKVETERKTIDLNQEIRQSVNLLERTIPKMIDIELHQEPCLWPIKADPVQIEQIILNIGKNAADAMPDGGKLVFATRNVRLDEADSRPDASLKPGNYVMLNISDSGIGMSKETVDHIFEPFYTTKEVGQGTGLGLASAYGIVMGHNGHITCQSQLGQGTTFTIYFPGIEAAVAASANEISPLTNGGSETVLLVDDEAAIREFASTALEYAGYRVLTAASGEEAVEVFRSRQDEIKVVVMDLGMPGMGGHKCLSALLSINPAGKVIIASGYAVNGQIRASIEAGAAGYIAKPYRSEELLKKLRIVLDDAVQGHRKSGNRSGLRLAIDAC